jgi:nucleoside-diphosphate-sugar epimerase
LNVVVTGAAGFLGHRLTDTLLTRGVLRGANGHDQPIDRVTLIDVVESRRRDDPRVVQISGDITDPALLERAINTHDAAAIFHLAAIVSGMAEADFDLGMRVNIDASRALLDVCRKAGHCPRLVFASSIAIFGGELPDVVPETTAVRPQSSYGMQKAVVELLINDYTRRGFVDGRVLRMPTISVRPGRPNAAASSFASGIIREPLNGEEAICPVSADTRLWLLSPGAAIDCLIAAHDLPGDALGTYRTLNVPGLSVTVAEMVAALERQAGADVAARIRWQRDPRIERIVSTWPGALDASRARALGFPCDDSFDAVVRRHMDEVTSQSRLA